MDQRTWQIAIPTVALAGLGVTIGYHRLLTHRSFSTHRAVGYTLAMLGSMAAGLEPEDWS